MDEENDPRIVTLLEEYRKLVADVTALHDEKNTFYMEKLAIIEKIHSKKLDSLNQWRDNEIEAARRFKDGNEYSSNCDFDRRQVEIDEKIRKLLFFKSQMLQKELPDAYKYFIEKGYTFDYMDSAKENKKDDAQLIEATISATPVIEQVLIDKEVDEIVNADKWKKAEIIAGKHITITMPSLPPLSGTITEIGDKSFNFLIDDTTNIIPISYLAVNEGIAEITVW